MIYQYIKKKHYAQKKTKRIIQKCLHCSPVPDIEWMSLGKNTTIKNTTGKYIISDFGRVLTIINAKPDNEGVYSCTGNGTTNSLSRRVFLNVTCTLMWFLVLQTMNNKENKCIS